MRRNKFIRFIFNHLYRWRMPEFVQYWRTGDLARAKLVTLENGSYGMIIEGEKYPLMGFPRGPVLFGPLARLKHLVKNLVFNQTWKFLEEGKTNEQTVSFIKQTAIPLILSEIEKSKYDMFPPEKLCPAVQELWRAMTAIEKKVSIPSFETLKRGVTFFFQEDDAYRFRVQILLPFLNPRSFWRKLYYFVKRKEYSLKNELKMLFNFAENMEVVSDMKGRIQLIKRVVTAILEDEEFAEVFEMLLKEIDYRKIKMTRADTYYARGKYLKVDWAKFDY